MDGSTKSETAVLSSVLSDLSSCSETGCFLQSKDTTMTDVAGATDEYLNTLGNDMKPGCSDLHLNNLIDNHLLHQVDPDISFYASPSQSSSLCHEMEASHQQQYESTGETQILSQSSTNRLLALRGLREHPPQNVDPMLMMLMTFDSPSISSRPSSDANNDNSNEGVRNNIVTSTSNQKSSAASHLSSSETSGNDLNSCPSLTHSSSDDSELQSIGYIETAREGSPQEISPHDSTYSFRLDSRKRAASTSLADTEGKPRVRRQADPLRSPTGRGSMELETLSSSASSVHAALFSQHHIDETHHHKQQQQQRPSLFSMLPQASSSHSRSMASSTTQQKSEKSSPQSQQHPIPTTPMTANINVCHSTCSPQCSTRYGTNSSETTTFSATTRSKCNNSNTLYSKRLKKTRQIDDQDIASPSDFESKSDIVAYVERKLERMEESFTFKSATYQMHLKRFLPKPDEKHRKYIERIETFPRIPTSAAEQRELINLRKVQRGMTPESRLGDGDGLTIKERLDEMLTSLVNKIMFLLVVKFDTWYIHAPAREQIREALLEFIWPDLPELHAFFREHFTLFIDMRIRHFRDSVARYFRDRPRTETKTGTTNTSAAQQKQFKDDYANNCSNHTSTTATGVSPLYSVSSFQNPTGNFLVDPVYSYGFVKAFSSPTPMITAATPNNQNTGGVTAAGYSTSTPGTMSNYFQQQQYSTTASNQQLGPVASITAGPPTIASSLSKTVTSEDAITSSPLQYHAPFQHSPEFSMLDSQQLLSGSGSHSGSCISTMGSLSTLGHDLLGNSDTPPTDSSSSCITQNDFLDFGSGSLSLVDDELCGYPSRTLPTSHLTSTTSLEALSCDNEMPPSYCHDDISEFSVTSENSVLPEEKRSFINPPPTFNSYLSSQPTTTTQFSVGTSSSPNFQDQQPRSSSNRPASLGSFSASSASSEMTENRHMASPVDLGASEEIRYPHNRLPLGVPFNPTSTGTSSPVTKLDVFDPAKVVTGSQPHTELSKSYNYAPQRLNSDGVLYQRTTPSVTQLYMSPPSCYLRATGSRSRSSIHCSNGHNMMSSLPVLAQSTSGVLLPTRKLSSHGSPCFASHSLSQYRIPPYSSLMLSPTTSSHCSQFYRQDSSSYCPRLSQTLGSEALQRAATLPSTLLPSVQPTANSTSSNSDGSSVEGRPFSPFMAGIPPLLPMTAQAAANSSSHQNNIHSHSVSNSQCSSTSFSESTAHEDRILQTNTPMSPLLQSSSHSIQPTLSSRSVQVHSHLPPQMVLHLDNQHRKNLLEQYFPSNVPSLRPSSSIASCEQSQRYQQSLSNSTAFRATDGTSRQS